MPLAWLRRSSRAVAALVLLVSMWQLPHRGQDDDICAPAQNEAHDESKHVFTTASGTRYRAPLEPLIAILAVSAFVPPRGGQGRDQSPAAAQVA